MGKSYYRSSSRLIKRMKKLGIKKAKVKKNKNIKKADVGHKQPAMPVTR